MDRRQQKTREAIFDAFGKLLSAKSYSKITVQDIIDAANIGRTTFYAHFDTKDALLEEMCLDIFEHVFSDSPHAEDTHDFSAKDAGAYELITHILHHLLDDERNVAGILTGESKRMFFHYFVPYFDKSVTQKFFITTKQKSASSRDDYLQNHISNSIIGTIQWWADHKFKQTPEEVTKLYLSVIEPVIS